MMLVLPADAFAQQRSAVPNSRYRSAARDPFRGTTAETSSPIEMLRMTRSDDETEPEITVVVPFEKGKDPLTATQVFLPYQQFVELWNRAHPERKFEAPAPVPAIVAAAAYSAEQVAEDDGKHARIAVRGRIVLYNFRKQPLAVELPLGKVAMRKARLNDESAPLTTARTTSKTSGRTSEKSAKQSQAVTKRKQPRTKDRLQVMLSKPGLNVLDVEFDLPVHTVGPAGRFTIPLVPVPAGRLSFALPEDDFEVRVNGTTAAYRRRVEAGRTWIDVPVDRGGDVTVAWQPASLREGVGTTVHAEGSLRLKIRDVGAELEADYEFLPRQGTLTEVTFAFPEPLKVRGISGPDLAGWQVAGDGAERTLRIELRRPIETNTRISFDLYLDARIGERETRIELPAFAPRGMTRETGTVAVYASERFSLAAHPTEALRRVEVATNDASKTARDEATDDDSTQRPRLVWRYVTRPFSLALDVSRRGAEIRSISLHAATIEMRQVILDSRITFDLRGAMRSRLELRLPTGFLPLEIEATDLADWYVAEDERSGSRILTVELGNPRQGSAEIVLRGRISKEPDDEFVELSVPEVVGSDRAEKYLAVHLHEAYAAAVSELAGWRTIAPGKLPDEMRRGTPAQLAFHSTSTEQSIAALELHRAEPRVTADSVTVVTVGEPAISYILSLQWNVDRAATDQFVFTTPAFLSGRLDFRAPGLRQIEESTLPDDRIRWTLTLQKPFSGRYYVVATATLPPPAEDVVTAPIPRFERIPERTANEEQAEPIRIEGQRHHVVLRNETQGRLLPVEADTAEKSSAAQLPIAVPPQLLDRAVAILRVPNSRKPPAWSIERFAAYRGAAAVIRVADLLTVHALDGTYRGQAIYTMRNRSRQYLPLSVPKGVRVISAMIGKIPARLVRGDDHDGVPVYLIPIPQTSRSDAPFEIRVTFASTDAEPLPRGIRLRAQDVAPRIPRVIGPEEDEERGVPVERTAWTVYLPDDMDAEPVEDSSRRNMTLADESTAEAVRSIGLLQEVLELGRVAYSSSEDALTRRRALGNYQRMKSKLRDTELYADEPTGTAREKTASKKSISEYFEKQRELQRFERENSRESIPDLSEDSTAANLGGELDQRAQSALNQKLASQLYSGNAGTRWESGTPADAARRFELKDGERKSDDGFSGKSKSGSKRKDWAKQGKEVDRGKLQAESEKQAAQQLFEYRNKANAPDSIPQRPMGLQSQTIRNMTQSSANEQAESENIIDGSPSTGLPPVYLPHAGFVATDGAVHFGGNATAARNAGTLSVDFDLAIPDTDEATVLTFTKVGGDPRLALAVRSRRTLETGFGALWSLAWLTVGIGAAVSLARSRTRRSLVRRIGWALAVIGLVAYFLLPGIWAGLSLAMFIIGGLIVVLLSSRPATATASASR